MDNIAPPSPPVTPPVGPKPAPKPKPPGGNIQTPKRIADNLDQLKREFAANPPPPAPAAKPRGRPRKAAAKPAPVEVKKEPVPVPRQPVRLDITTPDLSDNDSDDSGVPRPSPPGYEPPSEGLSWLTKGVLVAGAFAGAFLLGQHLFKSSDSADASGPAPVHSTRGARHASSPLLPDPSDDGSTSSDRHETARGPISKASVNEAQRRRPLSEATLKNAGSPVEPIERLPSS